METLYKNAPPIEETELEFCKRKMQDRGIFIGEQKATIIKLRRALGDIHEILEEVWRCQC